MRLITTKKELEKRELAMLAPYAVMSGKSAGREFPETEDHTRTVFQRDRDRIIHSKAFRRLSGKTQVFVATYGDHFRDRLSHSLEVAQVARDLCRNLALNEDLAEAIALAHDLGHTPFGHAGEHTLNLVMQKFGAHFEHNEQSKRVIETLEKQFPNFDGLNLTFEVRQGLAKHQTLYDQKTKAITGKTLEAQVVDIADEIAYHNHDLDDGLRSGLFDFRPSRSEATILLRLKGASTKDLNRLVLWKEALSIAQKKYGKNLEPIVLRHRTVSQLISLMIVDVLETTAGNLRRYRIRTLADVFKQPKNIVMFSASFTKKIMQLRKFLWDKMYQSERVLKHSRRGQKILKNLFWLFYGKPQLMPARFYERIGAPDPLEVVVKDYVAGCTDQFATQLYEMPQMHIRRHQGR